MNAPVQIPWTERVYHYFKGPNPLHPNIWNGRLSPLTFRRFEPADLPQCLTIYSLNEPGRFPQGVKADYERSLMEGTSYYLVAEQNGRIVASGGLHYRWRENLAVLCFGLVHPEFQGAGIGTALVLARFALLNSSWPAIAVFIFAVEKSIGYYQRFGFKPFSPWKDKDGQEHPSGQLLLTSGDIQRCRKLLAKQNILIPADEEKIPLHKRPEEPESQ